MKDNPGPDDPTQPATEPYVLVERAGDVALLSINRPARRNALSSEAAGAIAAAVEREGADARVLILTGAGKAFCAGGDLDELAEWSRASAQEISGTLYRTFQAMVRALRQTDAIVIAAVNGAAVGAGMDLALACDLRIAAQSARFGQVWVRLGVIPGTGGAFLTQALAGTTRAAEMLLTGDLVAAEQALRWNLVNEVVPDDALLDAAHTMAQRILRHPRSGVVANKQALVAASNDAVEAALAHAARVQPRRFISEEFKAAVRAARGG